MSEHPILEWIHARILDIVLWKYEHSGYTSTVVWAHELIHLSQTDTHKSGEEKV